MTEIPENNREQTITKFDAIDILDRTIGFVRNCDNKVAVFLGIFGIILTITITTGGINNLALIVNSAIADMSFYNVFYLPLMIGAILTLFFGLFRIIKVLDVQVDFSENAGLDMDSKIFFKYISKNNNYIAYKTKLLNMTNEEFINDISSQIYINACICNEKYRNYKCGLKMSLSGFSLFVVLWIIGAIMF
jgi:hypothetical protein